MPKLCQYLHCPYDATEMRDVVIPEIDDRTFVAHVCKPHAGALDKGAPLGIYAYSAHLKENASG